MRVLMATIVLLAALATGACGSDGRKDPIFANTPTGANARRLIRQLPRGLPGDHENARYTRQPMLAPAIAAPEEKRGG